LHVLVALGQLAERGERVGTQLVEDAGDELGELLVLAVSVEGEGVGWDRGVDCGEGVLSATGTVVETRVQEYSVEPGLIVGY